MATESVQLSQLVEFVPAYPFRGSIKHIPESSIRVIQMKDTFEDKRINWEDMTRCNLEGKRSPNWVQHDDIIVELRGKRNYAQHITMPPEKVVVSPHFALLRPKSKDILPTFLAWQLNQTPAQNYFLKTAEGSVQLSLRKSILESVFIKMPPISAQKEVVGLHLAIRKEQSLYYKMIKNRDKTIAAIAQKVLR